MNKFEYGQRVLHNKTDLAMIVGQDDESTYKIIPDGDYEWVYADADRLEPVSAWIPCSERMPENGCFVWVWSCGVAWFAEYRDGIFFQDGDYDSPMVNIAKWHPYFIPTPPQD